MTTPESEFLTLLSAARSGEERAVAKLIEQYEPKVRTVARVLLGRALRPYVDSLDLVQSVHRSILVGLRHEKFLPHTSEQLVALTVTIVRRKVARQWRKLQRQKRLESGRSEIGNLSDVLESLSDSQPSVEQQVQFKDQLELLCEHLDPQTRRILELKLLGFNSTEVGQEMGMHAVAIRVRWSRLRRRLQDSGVVLDWA